ncbi:Pentatricopeptide repeat-containing protein [Heracleum sosnowskyi]|uniref:Pentatricopeptide repeat-containing protein n=1 Tax=Heracleum sosnowskyi TaxID=360622 RepID=A0AAD8JI21_9APIA|nr:Pentatricopeptide repeat-containing protein [Heracleum sosnowskyi]
MITRHLIFKTLPTATLNTLNKSQRCYSFQHANHLFDEIPHPDNISIHRSMLTEIGKNCHSGALDIFKKQLHLGLFNIDEVAIAIALKACRGDLKFGCQIHGFAVTYGFFGYLTVSNALMSLYCKSGEFKKALSIFEDLDSPDVVSLNTILSGFQDVEDALSFACKINSSGVKFDAVTYTTVLSRCAHNEEFCFGSQLHSLVLKCGMEGEIYIGNALITLYTKWGKMVEADKLFKYMPKKDLVSWNAMLSGYSQEGNYDVEAIGAFVQMVREGMKLDHVSFTSVLSSCGNEINLKLGRQVHGLTIKRGFEMHVSLCNVLISMYSKCEVIKDAQMVFWSMTDRNVISWTTMISINKEIAVSLFNEMRLDGVYPNEVTFVGLINAITTNDMVSEGKMVHGFCMKTSFVSKLNVANSFITMYARFKALEDSKKVFDELECREIVSWNALISGYDHSGMYQEAVQTFSLARVHLQPNHYSFGSVLSAIGASESISIRHGEMCHSCLMKLGLNKDPIVLNALLDMYAKRGHLLESLKIFKEIPERSQIAWTAIISAYARHGDYESVMNLFKEMEREHVRPDSLTFLSVLTVCGRKGMVDKGRELFESMVSVYSIEPSHEHYSCMVDMLGRAGRLDEAEELVKQIPGGPGLSVFQSLLGSCRVHGNVELGQWAADTVMQIEPQESGSYVLMSNLYAEKGDWEKAAMIRKMMRNRGVKKEIGFSWADVGDTAGSLHLHGFSSDDKSHKQWEEIYRMAECLGSGMKLILKAGEEVALQV